MHVIMQIDMFVKRFQILQYSISLKCPLHIASYAPRIGVFVRWCVTNALSTLHNSRLTQSDVLVLHYQYYSTSLYAHRRKKYYGAHCAKYGAVQKTLAADMITCETGVYTCIDGRNAKLARVP